MFEVKDVLSVVISVSGVHIGDLDAWQAARHSRTDPLLRASDFTCCSLVGLVRYATSSSFVLLGSCHSRRTLMLRSRFEEGHVVHSRAATVWRLKPSERRSIAKLHPLLVRGRQCSLRQHVLKVSSGADAFGRVKQGWLALLLGLSSGRLLIVAGRALKQVIVSLLHLIPAWLDNNIYLMRIVIVNHVWSGRNLIIHCLRLVVKVFLSLPRAKYHVGVVKVREG